MIKNIVFDMGNVLTEWNPGEMLKEMGIPEGIDAIVRHELFESPEWIMLDAGKIQAQHALERIFDRLQYHLESGFYPDASQIPLEAGENLREVLEANIQFAMENWTNYKKPLPETQFLPETLKEAGYQVYLLTNAGIVFRKYEGTIPAFRAMDGIFVSAEHQMLKPDQEIYLALLSEFNLNASETLFIDDNPVNVAGGIMTGIEGIVYRGNVNELISELKRFGVCVTAPDPFKLPEL